MTTNHIAHMQMAREIEEQSPHPTHKVGALLHGFDTNKQPFIIAKSNFWPPVLEHSIGRDTKLGNASTTVHAEIAAILSAPTTEGATLYITDLPCPNCTKAIAESNIKTVYIDAHTHNTALGKKIKPFFDDVSLEICKKAKINVFEINLDNETITPLFTAKDQSSENIENPVHVQKIEDTASNQDAFLNLIKHHNETEPFAACIAKSSDNQFHFLSARPHRANGLSEEDVKHLRNIQSKYLPTLQPLNRLLLTCARLGLSIEENHLYSSQTPTSREFVNMIGAGHTKLTIGDKTKCRDEWGLQALKQLQKLNILKFDTP